MRAYRSPVGLISLALALLQAPPARGEEQAPRPPEIQPIEIGFTERTGRSLLFLDVEGVDKQGNPLPGLKGEDFKIRVNSVSRTIYSVDDLCPCGAAAPDPTQPPANPAEAARLAHGAAAPHFAIYFDFSQLGTAGREQAIAAARRWATERMRSGDRVLVVAYATDSGLRVLAELTDERDAVLRGIDAAAADPELVDPFPAELGERKQLCATGTVSCSNVGRREYFHGRRSMEVLRNFLTDLGEIPERKSMLLFHENATLFPGRIYGAAPEFIAESIHDEIRGYANPLDERVARMRGAGGFVPHLLRLEESLGGAATASRTVVYPIQCGTAGMWNVNLGANLADQTGGEYNRRAEDVEALLEAAGRRCPCIYRIALDMTGKERSYVLRTKVKVGKRKLPSRYRIEYLTEEDRWMRKAQLVLAEPEVWRDLDVRAAVVPLRSSDKTWDVAVQIVVDTTTLGRSFAGEHDGEWEVAALVGNAGFRKSWELLGVYRANPGSREAARGVVLHEGRLEGLKPGRYELRTFVRDRETNRFGGARFEIELPVPQSGGLAGPVLLDPEGPAQGHYRSVLPRRKNKKPEPATSTRHPGRLPLGTRVAVAAGQPVQFVTWHCADATPSLRSVLRRAGADRWSSKPVVLDRSGACVELSDIVETERLPAGQYVYELTEEGDAGLLTSASFEIVAPAR